MTTTATTTMIMVGFNVEEGDFSMQELASAASALAKEGQCDGQLLMAGPCKL